MSSLRKTRFSPVACRAPTLHLRLKLNGSVNSTSRSGTASLARDRSSVEDRRRSRGVVDDHDLEALVLRGREHDRTVSTTITRSGTADDAGRPDRRDDDRCRRGQVRLALDVVGARRPALARDGSDARPGRGGPGRRGPRRPTPTASPRRCRRPSLAPRASGRAPRARAHDPACPLGDPQDQVVVLRAVVARAEAADVDGQVSAQHREVGQRSCGGAAAPATSPACGTASASRPRRSSGPGRCRGSRGRASRPTASATRASAAVGQHVVVVEQDDELARRREAQRVLRRGHDAAVLVPQVHPDPRLASGQRGEPVPGRPGRGAVVDQHPLPVGVRLTEDRGDGVLEGVRRVGRRRR